MTIFLVFIPTIAPDILWGDFLRAIPLVFLTIMSVGTFGWLIGSIALTTRWVEMLDNVVAYTMMIVCGINFPVTALPKAVQTLNQYIAMASGLLAVRAVIDGASYESIIPLLVRELVIAFVYGAIAWLVFKYRLNVLRSSGNYELV